MNRGVCCRRADMGMRDAAPGMAMETRRAVAGEVRRKMGGVWRKMRCRTAGEVRRNMRGAWRKMRCRTAGEVRHCAGREMWRRGARREVWRAAAEMLGATEMRAAAEMRAATDMSAAASGTTTAARRCCRGHAGHAECKADGRHACRNSAHDLNSRFGRLHT
jgi:hypothetical protein